MNADRGTPGDGRDKAIPAAGMSASYYRIAYRYMTFADKTKFDAILCDHCIYQSKKETGTDRKYCDYSNVLKQCRKCTPFECIQKGYFEQKSKSRKIDINKTQEEIELFVRKLLERLPP